MLKGCLELNTIVLERLRRIRKRYVMEKKVFVWAMVSQVIYTAIVATVQVQMVRNIILMILVIAFMVLDRVAMKLDVRLMQYMSIIST